MKKVLNEQLVRKISKIKQEPRFMLDFRLQSLRKFNELDNPNFTSIKLLLYNNKYQYYNLIYTTDNNIVNFSISDKVNDGILLDNIDIGNYYLFIEINYPKDKKKYYPLINNTKYNIYKQLF